MNPDLASYDWIMISSSAGKDSQAMLDYVCELAESAGVLDRVIVLHCDLGRVEWAGTSTLAERQAQRYRVRFEVVSRRQGDLLTHVEARGKWPGPSTRYCTSDHKRAQVRRVMTQLAAETARLLFFSFRAARPARILDCQGLRAEESPARRDCRLCKGKPGWRESCVLCGGSGRRLPFERDQRASNGRRIVDTWYPIHTWPLDDVWARVRASRTADLVHPAYGLGMPRLSCVFCIFAPATALVLAGKHNRDLLAEYVRVERDIGHAFRTDVTLAKIQQAVEAGVDAGPVSTWGAQ